MGNNLITTARIGYEQIYYLRILLGNVPREYRLVGFKF